MYRCKECGAEYEVKPDYCDCGNDEFEVTIAQNKTEESILEVNFSEKTQEKATEEKWNYEKIKLFNRSFLFLVYESGTSRCNAHNQ